MNGENSVIPVNFLVSGENPSYPPRNVVVVFGKSKSEFFEKALRFAKNKSDFSENGNEFYASFEWIKSAKDVFGLLKIVGMWKSTRVLIDGRSEDPTKFEAQRWCFESRRFSALPEAYCERDSTPCHAIYFYELTSQEWKTDFGKFDENFVWHFDKEKIKRKLVIEFDKVKYYPAMSSLKIRQLQEIVAGIPDVVDPRDDANWDFIFPRSNTINITISLGAIDTPKKKTEAIPIGIKKLKTEEKKDDVYCLPFESAPSQVALMLSHIKF